METPKTTILKKCEVALKSAAEKWSDKNASQLKKFSTLRYCKKKLSGTHVKLTI